MFAIEDKLLQDANQQREAILGHIQKQISWLEDLTSSIERSELKLSAVKEFGSQQEAYLVRRELTSDITKQAGKLAYLHTNVTCEKPAIHGIDKARQTLQTCFRKSLNVNTVKGHTTDLPPLKQKRGMSTRNRSILHKPKRQEITRPNMYTYRAGVHYGNETDDTGYESASYGHPNFVSSPIRAASKMKRDKFSNTHTYDNYNNNQW